MADQRRRATYMEPDQRAAILEAQIGRWVEVTYLRGAIERACGWLGLCEDANEIVIEGDGGAVFVPIRSLVHIEV